MCWEYDRNLWKSIDKQEGREKKNVAFDKVYELLCWCKKIWETFFWFVDCYIAMTTGGTESILMAVKSYRDRARDLYNITNPEMYISSISFVLL